MIIRTQILVYTTLLNKIPVSLFLGAHVTSCIMLHNANPAFSEISKFDVEDHSVDIYYWFDKSSERKSCLFEYYMFCVQDYKEVIRYVSTRWLCLEKCVAREHKKYFIILLFVIFFQKGLKMNDLNALKKHSMTRKQNFT